MTAGSDGKINLVQAGQSELQFDCLHDNHSVLSYTAVCWASPTEFVLAGQGAGVQRWDNHRRGGAVAQSLVKWQQGGCIWSQQHSHWRCPPFSQTSLRGWRIKRNSPGMGSEVAE